MCHICIDVLLFNDTNVLINTSYMLYVFVGRWMISVYYTHGCEWMGCTYISFMFIYMCYSIKGEAISNTVVGNILGLSVAEGE